MKFPFWPRTLSRQLIAVTILAVILSNVAVLIWFERGNERRLQSTGTERLLDRAISTTVLMGSIRPEARGEAARAMSSHFTRFQVVPYIADTHNMTPEERALANRARAMLPQETRQFPVAARFREKLPGDMPMRWRNREGRVTLLSLPISRDSTLMVTQFTLPPRRWPAELTIAALLATLVASAWPRSRWASRRCRSSPAPSTPPTRAACMPACPSRCAAVQRA